MSMIVRESLSMSLKYILKCWYMFFEGPTSQHTCASVHSIHHPWNLTWNPLISNVKELRPCLISNHLHVRGSSFQHEKLQLRIVHILLSEWCFSNIDKHYSGHLWMRSDFRNAKNLGFLLGPRCPHAVTCIPKAPRHRSDRCQPQGPQGLASWGIFPFGSPKMKVFIDSYILFLGWQSQWTPWFDILSGKHTKKTID